MLTNKERLFSLGILATSLLLTLQSFRYPAESSHFPRFLCLLMTLFSVLLLARSAKRAADGEKGEGFSKGAKIPAMVFSATAAYVFAVNYVGYFVSTVVFMFLAMFLFGERRILPMAGATAVFLGVVYALFVSFLGLRLPEGILF